MVENLNHDFSEEELQKRLTGKTLICEMPFPESQLEVVRHNFRNFFQVHGFEIPRVALVLADTAPAIYGSWLTNEAFYHFQSGAFWPRALANIGIEHPNRYSSDFGQGFLHALNKLSLPTFRRMKTRLSYLGPILAHSGIPKSCLPEYFEKVLPRAAQFDVRGEDDFNELVESLPTLYLSKPTERFLTYGEGVARDFVSRTLELDRLYSSSRQVAAPAELGLPERVVDAYREWVESGGENRHVGETRRLLRRPQLRVDPSQGVVLELPGQSLASDERRAEWRVESEIGEESAPYCVDVSPDPGSRLSLEDAVVLAEPYRQLTVSYLVAGNELRAWPFAGLSPDKPILFFSSETDAVIPPRSLQSGHLGIVAPRDWEISGRCAGQQVEARLVEDRGQMPLGWGRMSARVVDLDDSDEVVFEDPNKGGRSFSQKLGEAPASRPRLVNCNGREISDSGGSRVFIGDAPVIEVDCGIAANVDTISEWRFYGRSLLDQTDAESSFVTSIAGLELISNDGRWLRIALGQSALLGERPWGEFEVKFAGPIGQDERFRFRVLPPIEIVCDVDEWSGEQDAVQARLRVADGVSVYGAEQTADPSEFVVTTTSRAHRVEIETVGFGGSVVRLPLEVRLPRPSWSVYDPARKQALLTWSRKCLPLSLTEVEGIAPTLQLRLQTPAGIPTSAELELRGPDGCIFNDLVYFDENGFGTADLTPFFAAARQRTSAKLDVVLRVKLNRFVEFPCLEIRREWSPRDFECTEDESGDLRFQWEEQIPVANRALRVESLLTPWEDSHWIDIPDDRRDGLPLPPDQFAKECGIYRVTLGRRDEWSGKFEPAADAECDVSIGDASNWTRSPLFSDTGPNGYLYRLLLEHYAQIGGNLEPPAVREMSEDLTFALRLLRTRRALMQDGADRLRRKVDALLDRAQLGPVLAALAGDAEQESPEALLRVGLLSRTWRDNEKAAALTLRDKESLWKIWKPLGIWTEMHTYRADVSGAEARVVRQLGAEALQSLSPLQEGSKLRWRNGPDDRGFEARVVRVENDTGRSPFELVRLDAGVEVVCTTDGLDENSVEFHLRGGLNGKWMPEASDDERTEMLRAELSKRERLDVFYPTPVPEICQPPDSRMLELIHLNNRDTIETIRHQAEDIVRIPIGGSAFQTASFEWALMAAADSQYRSEILRLSNDFAVPVGSTFERDPTSFRDAASWRIFAEAKSRWIRNSLGEALFAVPLLSWLVAVDVIWPSLGKNGWLRTSDEKRRDLSIDLYRLMPRLFEHDLLKVCAIEMLDRARWVYRS